MTCSSCGHDNPAAAKFCLECGQAFALSCSQCSTELPAGAKFCLECGTATSASASAPAPAAASDRAPATYTPKHLADKILSSKSALEGERKQVTVLFADVKGSMELAEQLDPEEWHRILEGFFQILTDGVHRFEGTVNQYTGDGIMALFGAPIAHEDHAERACYAALQLRDAVRGHANDVRLRHGIPFGVRIGLNSGEVVVGKIGDDLRMDYTAQGHTVGLAQRMETLAESGHICLSEHTARRVEGFFELTDLGRTQVKGVREPVGLFDLEGVGAFRTRLDRSRARGLSTFVGRDRDMAMLETALERAKAGDAQVVGVMADAGTGKSRLCAEFIEGCRADGVPVFEGRGVAHGKSIPMLPMLELWRAFYGIREGDDPESTRTKIAGRLLLMDEGFRKMLPLLFDVFGVPDPENPAPPMSAEERQKLLHRAVRQVLHDPAQKGARVLLLEDLHWFDGGSDAFVETIVESAPATHDLILLNFRPEYQARWMQRSYYQQLPLQPLGPDAIRSLVRDQLGDHPSVAALPEMIHERTKGNPFFIEEVVQTLVENGHLAGARGAYELKTAIEALEVPPSVQAVLAARIDRLPEREKQLLQTAAVIGKTFPEPLLRAVVSSVSELDDLELGEALAALVASEFLFEASLYPQLEYSFKHPLTQEVAQSSQLRERRIRVHAAVAQAIEATADNLDERAAEIAQHWAEAETPGRAVGWYRRAARWASLSDPREALGHWRRIRQLLPGVEDERERDEFQLQACVQLLSLGWRMGGSEEESRAVFAEGRALAERMGDRTALAKMVGFYGLMRSQLVGSALDYIRYGEEAAAIAADSGDPALRAAIGTLPAFGHFYAGAGHPTLSWADRVLEDTGTDCSVGKEITGYSPRAAMHHARTSALMFLGRLEEAAGACRDAERVAEEAQEFEVLGWVLHVFTMLVHLRGGGSSTLDHGRRCLETAERLDNESSRMLAHTALGFAHLTDARPADAREALGQAVVIARKHRSQLGYLPITLATLAETHLALGEDERARAAAQEAIDMGRANGNEFAEAMAQLALSMVLLTSDGTPPRAEVEAALERADELVESLDARSLSPRILEQRGKLAAALGDAAASSSLRSQALDLYREIGATGHAERLANELATCP